jgi:hypothetical protein
MGIKGWISKVLPRKGKNSHIIEREGAQLTSGRFGWVNASYVYGLGFTNAHMQRAIGTLTDWDSYAKATATGNTL